MEGMIGWVIGVIFLMTIIYWNMQVENSVVGLLEYELVAGCERARPWSAVEADPSSNSTGYSNNNMADTKNNNPFWNVKEIYI